MAILPAPGDLTKPYWEHLRRRELVIQRCHNCRRRWHPPLPRCPYCHCTEIGWQRVSGQGTVYSFTIVQHATHVAFADRVPYVVALVELVEGPKVVADIRRCAPSNVHIGMWVQVSFEDVTDEITLAPFVPADD